ncbi:MAG: FlgD immunoglobulin-like domain containing protein [bacterium]
MRTLAGCLTLVLCTVSAAAAYPNQSAVFSNATVFLAVDGCFADSIVACGCCSLEWSDPYYYDGAYHVQMLVTALETRGALPAPYGSVVFLADPAYQSGGQATSLHPTGMFPAASFIDYHLRCLMPGLFPGDTLRISPMRVTSEIDQMPPYFEPYLKQGTAGLTISTGAGTPVGEITFWQEDALPYAPPAAHIVAPVPRPMNPRRSAPTDTLRVSAAMAGGLVAPMSATFSARPAGAGGPFQPFGTDTSGSAISASTVSASPAGDGWSGYLDTSAYSDTGAYFEMQAACFVPGIGPFRDTITTFVDPTPCVPEITSLAADSFSVVQTGAAVPLFFRISDANPETVKVWAGPVVSDFLHSVTPINQHRIRFVTAAGLATNQACAPTAAASCLDYFAENGYDGLDHPKGDTGKPEQTPDDMARELGTGMNTSSADGTTPNGTTAGIKGYLTGHQQSGWDVEFKEMSACGLAELYEDFAADSEDVLLWFEDTTAAGQPAYHVATMNRLKTEKVLIQHGEFQCYTTRTVIGFMDPKGAFDREHEIWRHGNEVETEGYGFQPGGGDAVIHGWTKVSPPPQPRGRSAPPGSPIAEAGLSEGGFWTLVAQGPARGSGLEDSLYWDTSGFPEGFYLIRVSVDDPGGPSGYDLRLASLVDTTAAGAPPALAGSPVSIRGTYPNPFNAGVLIEVAVQADCAVSLTIYDVSGRRVKRLCESRSVPAGVHRLTWDGTDDRGKPVASGAYLCRLSSPAGRPQQSRLILLR